MKGKIKWIILGIIAILILVSIAVIVINEMQLQYEVAEIKEYNYFVLEKEGKSGVIDKNGNVIIEPNYMAVQIPNPSKPIFVCFSDYNQENQNYETAVYNEKGEQILTNYQHVRSHCH